MTRGKSKSVAPISLIRSSFNEAARNHARKVPMPQLFDYQ